MTSVMVLLPATAFPSTSFVYLVGMVGNFTGAKFPTIRKDGTGRARRGPHTIQAASREGLTRLYGAGLQCLQPTFPHGPSEWRRERMAFLRRAFARSFTRLDLVF